MYESYIKEVPIVDLKKTDYDYSIIKSILEAEKKLEIAHKNFNYANGELVDYYAYQIKSEQAKIDYLLKQAKNKKIVLDSIQARKIIKNKQITLAN